MSESKAGQIVENALSLEGESAIEEPKNYLMK